MDIFEGKKVVTVGQAAEFLDIGRDAAYSAIHAGTIPSLRIGRLIRIPVVGLLRMVEQAADRNVA